MGWPRHHGPEDLDHVLGELPDAYTVRAIGSARFVIGPTGAHVVALDDGTEAAPRAVALLASVARSALADRVAWVPFVHALLVTDRTEPCPPATRVPPGAIPTVLLEGPPVLSPAELGRLVASVTEGVLDGLTAVAPPAGRTPATH
jgi:hypothetical protein